ncbi:MAG TPA: PKD domain-containing protein [Bacteroidales bacterium]|nr:T9SS type A sorting domain-containing protein [Bacteroidales bacterium]HOX78980.1 PKD domain-containing protein [Bacteroidales bacterium]HPI87630.1 PKD domain-containing protein [Bacteroidales bacterium]
MKRIMNIIQKQYRTKAIICAAVVTLMSFIVLPVSSQIIAGQKNICLSGQLTSTNTGAPIADHEIYITSDSLTNGGFGYYAVTRTDVNGFYWDTLTTTTNDGIIKIYVYDFDNNRIELDRYYRFIWENQYLMFADFAIFDPEANPDLQANFIPTPDTLDDNPMKIIFRDQSIGSSIKSWYWDFGDGKSSTVQDPDHIYDASGIYMVSLTITTMPPEYGVSESSTITKQVQVGLREFHHLGGHVFASYFPIDYGLAYLYLYDDHNNLIPVDTTRIDTLGYYFFYEVPVGKYLTKTRLESNSVHYGQFMPTYFRNAIDWNDATPIIVDDNDNWECDINLRPSAGLGAGSGEILGQISYDTSLVVRTLVPAGNIEIVLMDAKGGCLTCTLSDMEGYFLFNDLAYGTYQLFPDVAGVTSTPMYITISEENPALDDISLVIYPGEITFSINENVSDYVGNAMMVYPNPVNDQARLSVEIKKNTTATVVITDIAGRMVYRQETRLSEGMQNIVIPVRDLQKGIYQVTLIPEDRVLVSGKFLKMD